MWLLAAFFLVSLIFLLPLYFRNRTRKHRTTFVLGLAMIFVGLSSTFLFETIGVSEPVDLLFGIIAGSALYPVYDYFAKANSWQRADFWLIIESFFNFF